MFDKMMAGFSLPLCVICATIRNCMARKISKTVSILLLIFLATADNGEDIFFYVLSLVWGFIFPRNGHHRNLS